MTEPKYQIGDREKKENLKFFGIESFDICPICNCEVDNLIYVGAWMCSDCSGRYEDCSDEEDD